MANKAIIAGAGLAGASAARTLLDAGWDVNVWESCPCVGGACADILDSGSYVQLYGPHHFRTDSPEAWAFMQRFAEWVPSLILFGVELWPGADAVPIPINDRSEQIAGKLSDAEIEEMVFAPYTLKMWGRRWDEMPEAVRKRVKLRNDGFDLRYVHKAIQALPCSSWTQIIGAMLDGATVKTRSPWTLDKWDGETQVVYTGEPDALLDYRFGPLKWRGARFEHNVKMDCALNEYSSVNTPHAAESALRKYENSRFIGIDVAKNASKQYPADEPHYYPAGERADWERYAAEVPKGIVLAGRLAKYKYLDMDAAILDGIDAARELIK